LAGVVRSLRKKDEPAGGARSERIFHLPSMTRQAPARRKRPH
jgi:hypothetical protein